MLFQIKAKRPSIILSQSEAARLEPLAFRLELIDSNAGAFLLAEIYRAEIRGDDQVPVDVVRMHSEVTFVEERQGTPHTICLVYPDEVDISRQQVSVLTPIGAALIGLSKGQSIACPSGDGIERWVRVVRVHNGAGDPPPVPAA
jgi:regulator of nucleoside diphosphate kinase